MATFSGKFDQKTQSFRFTMSPHINIPGADALAINAFVSTAVVPEDGDVFALSTDRFNRPTVSGDIFLAVATGTDDLAGRSWLYSCRVESVSETTVTSMADHVVETTGRNGTDAFVTAEAVNDAYAAATSEQKQTARDNIGALAAAGGTMTGALTLSGAPTENLHAATKQYVDEHVPAVATAEAAGIVKPNTDFDIAADGTLSLYKQIAVSSVSVSPSTVEKGTVVTAVNVTWAVNKTPESQTVNGEDVGTGARSKAYTGQSITSDTQYTVSAADARASKSASAWLRFYDSVYYGASPAWSREGMTGVVRGSNIASFSVNAGAEDYIWYAIPAAYATPVFWVGGIAGGFSLYATQNVTNASGRTTSYKIFRSDNVALGQTTVTLTAS